MSFLTNLFGIIGVGLLLAAYFLLQSKKLQSDDYSYLLLNLSGAALITVSLLYSWNLPAFIIEAAWVLISLYGLFKRRQKDKALL